MVSLGAADGGYFPTSWGWSCAALAWVAAAGVLTRERVVLGRPAVVSLAGLAGLTVWIALSLAWTASVPLTALELQRSLVPLAGLAAGLALPRAGASGLPVGIAAAALVIAAWNLLAGGNAPLGYANGLAALCVVGILLTAGLAVETGDRRALPAALLACLVLALVVYRAESRAAWLALAGGAAAMLALRASRPGIALALVTVVAATALAVAGAVGSEERQAYWAVALGDVPRNVPFGTGAGTWERSWLEHRDEAIPARDAHSLYLQSLAELGPLGLAAVLAALLAPLAAAVRSRAAPFVRPAAGAYVAFLLHLGVDWEWKLTAVSLAGVLLAASLLSAERSAGAVIVPRRAAVAALAVVALLALAALPGNLLTSRAAERLRAGDWNAAETAARRAARLAPWAGEPWRLLGEAERAEGRREQAAASFREGLERDDGDPELWRALARVASADELRRARARAAQLDPLGG